MSSLPTMPAHRLCERSEDQKWLVEELWTVGGVGIIGGEPKCCKSFMALSMAVAVSAEVPCLWKYKVHKKGRVVLYAAEDAPHIVKGRLNGICRMQDLDLESLDIHVITASVLRLDKREDQERLKETIKELRPILLILDPFVRLHRIDENSSGEVALILASLREIQREYQTSIVVVHHAKKGAAMARAGQALRGSSEFHAWGDVNLYLRRNKYEHLYLSIEHRDAKSQSGIPIKLVVEEGNLALKALGNNIQLSTEESDVDNSSSVTEKINKLFSNNDTILSFVEIRSSIKLRATKVSDAIKELVRSSQIKKVQGGYQKCSGVNSASVPVNP